MVQAIAISIPIGIAGAVIGDRRPVMAYKANWTKVWMVMRDMQMRNAEIDLSKTTQQRLGYSHSIESSAQAGFWH